AVRIGTYAISTITPTASQVLAWNTTTTSWAPSTETTGTVTSVVSGTGLVAGTLTSNGTIDVNVGTAANQIVQLNGSAQYPIADGSLITNINAVRIGTNAVSTITPTGSQVLAWNTTTTSWAPSSAASGTVMSVVSG